MKNRFFRFGFILGGLLLLPSLALANGFAINEMGTKAVGMGGAFAAQADDPSAVYYNPAGIVQLEGTQVSGGMGFILPRASFRSNGTSAFGSAGEVTETSKQTFFVPNLFTTHKCAIRHSLGNHRYNFLLYLLVLNF